MSTPVEEAVCEQCAQLTDLRRTSEETWKSAEMPEVRDEEIGISYQNNRYPESTVC